MVDENNIFGWIGGGLSVIYNLPQIWHLWRTKKATGVNRTSIAMRIVSYVLVMVHGYIRHDHPILYTTGAGLVQLVVMYSKYVFTRTYLPTIVPPTPNKMPYNQQPCCLSVDSRTHKKGAKYGKHAAAAPDRALQGLDGSRHDCPPRLQPIGQQDSFAISFAEIDVSRGCRRKKTCGPSC